MILVHKRVIALTVFFSLALMCLMFLPAFVSAQGAGLSSGAYSPGTSLIDKLGSTINLLIGLFIALAVVVFFWGLIKWLWSMGPDDAQQGLKIMFWGVVALFVMVSIWGIVRLLQQSLEVEDNDSFPPPTVVLD